jgi:hypothetical protein
MRYALNAFFWLVVCMSLLLLASPSTADDWNRATTAIFNQPVQIPGKVLPPGIYVFKLADFSGDRHVVQIWNADETLLVATLLGWPDYVREAPNENRFVLEERGRGEPAALKAWFFRGDTSVETFLYDKKLER